MKKFQVERHKKAIYKQVKEQPDASFLYKNEVFDYFPVPFHYHPEFELIYVVESSGIRIIGDNIGQYFPGDLVLIGESLPHVYISDLVYRTGDIKKGVHGIAIQFKKDFAGSQFLNIPEMASAKIVLEKAAFGISVEGEAKKKIISIMNGMEKMNNQERFTGLIQILFELGNTSVIKTLASDYFVKKGNSQNDNRINRIHKYIFENFRSKSISLDDISTYTGMSKPAFCRYFKKRMGQTFSQYVNELRIKYATELLIVNRSSITQIAFESGFENLSYFNRQFKKNMGISPTGFLKSIIR